MAKEGFTEASLGLLANQRRRQLLTGLLKSLRTIKTLVKLTHMVYYAGGGRPGSNHGATTSFCVSAAANKHYMLTVMY